jgi:hypothetical protein
MNRNIRRCLCLLMLSFACFAVAGCETPASWSARFTNSATYTADIYLNSTLQFSLVKGQDQQCDMKNGDVLEVRDHATSTSESSRTVSFTGAIKNVQYIVEISDSGVTWVASISS